MSASTVGLKRGGSDDEGGNSLDELFEDPQTSTMDSRTSIPFGGARAQIL